MRPGTIGVGWGKEKEIVPIDLNYLEYENEKTSDLLHQLNIFPWDMVGEEPPARVELRKKICQLRKTLYYEYFGTRGLQSSNSS